MSEEGSGRGGRGYRKGKRHTYSHHLADENWYVKPIIDQAQARSWPEPEPEHEPISYLPSSSIPLSAFLVNDKKQFQNRQNNGRGYRVKVEPSTHDENNKHWDAKEENLRDGHNLEMENELRKDENLQKGDEKAGNDDVEEESEEEEAAAAECKVAMEDVVKRLEEMSIGAKEPELSEEMLRTNDQAQEDELLAMESIYGDNIFILDRQNGLRSFQIHVHTKAPKELMVSAKPNSSGSVDTQTDDTSDFSYLFKIEYLPPIILTCLFPKSYPSHLAPYFTLYVQWLASAKISNLCHMLDSVWKEQKGQEVMYQWVEWLQSSSLSHLGFDTEVILGPYGVRYSGDSRAISGSVSPDIDIPLMKSYNEEQHHKNFRRNLHKCRICLSTFAGTDFVKLPCHHFFCWNCMKTYSDMYVKECTISKLLCPDENCGDMIPPGLLKQLLGDEEFERWEAMMLQKTLESMSTITYCPRCQSVCTEDEEQHAQCSKCYFSFCTLCKERRHVGVACITPDMKLFILQERQNSSQLTDEQKRQEQDVISELLNVREIHRFAKQCPSCKMAISRTEGCNSMRCENCGQYFCYHCNQEIDESYEHFSEGKCELDHLETTIQTWEERMNARHIMGQKQEQIFVDLSHECPNCRQVNMKADNNNHIFCWACQKHYCYLCRKMVRRSSLHYNPNGCKQHTVG